MLVYFIVRVLGSLEAWVAALHYIQIHLPEECLCTNESRMHRLLQRILLFIHSLLYSFVQLQLYSYLLSQLNMRQTPGKFTT